MKVKQVYYGDPWPLNLPWQEDPVRPELDREFRFTAGREVFTNGGAIVCLSYCKGVPSMINHLTTMVGLDYVVFYTVWSRQRGAGKTLVLDLLNFMLETRPWQKRYVTLSPKTQMAYNFHTKNGATLYRENQGSDNYEYHTGMEKT